MFHAGRYRTRDGSRWQVLVRSLALMGMMALLVAACADGDDAAENDDPTDDVEDDAAPEEEDDTAGEEDDTAEEGGDDAAEEGDTLTLRFAFEGPPETNQQNASDFFEEALVEVSDGAMEIDPYGGGELGGEPELLEQLQAGTLPLVNSSTANAAILDDVSGVFSLHYLFESPEHQTAALKDPEVVQAYADMMDDEDVKLLTLYTLPLRHMYSDGTEVRSPDDLEGRSVRVQATDTEEAFFGAYGAQTVNMAFPELYSALQTGVVDFAENAITYYAGSNHQEVAATMSATQHAGNTQAIWVSRPTWDDLSDQQQEWLQEAADRVNDQAVDSAFELEDEVRERLDSEEENFEFIEDVDREAFQEAAQPVFDELVADFGPEAEELVELIRAHR